ncbi:MAG: hypothetical protein WA109_06995 [Bellilinea sp.]
MNQPVSSAKAKNLTVWIIVVILLQAGVKIWALIRDAIPFNADEAVVALMARHILQGERPVFFYGQAYMGSADAYLVAAGFWIFGEQIWVIRLVQSLLYLGTILTTMWIVARLAGNPRAAAISGVLLAAPAVNMTLYTTASLGGYGEALLLGNFIFIAGFKLVGRLPALAESGGLSKRIAFPAFLLGLLAGMGLWVNGLTLVYAIPMLFFILYKVAKARIWRTLAFLFGFGLVGVLIGALPWGLYAAQNGFQALTGELFGSAIAVEGGSYALRILNHLSSLMLLSSSAILGLRPPWEVKWIVLPLIPVVVGVWVIILYAGIRKMSRPFPGRAVLAIYGGMALTLAAAFIFTSFGADPSGRYFLPVQVALAAMAGFVFADWTRKKPAAGLVIAFLLVYQLTGNIQAILQNPPGLTTQFYEPARLNHQYMDDLIQFLDENGETRGYTNYWVSYPLAFKTDEKLIFVPRLPYHPDLRYTSRDDRYPPYDGIVLASQRIAYITSKNPELDQRLRREFAAMNVTYKEAEIGDYRVFYALSTAIRPEELAIYLGQP